MRQNYVMGNWKMNGSNAAIQALLPAISHAITPLKTNCVVFPPASYLSLAKQLLNNSTISLGAQNVYPENQGAYTGEMSGPMLKDIGCQYVLVGHSERRQLFAENENFIAKKFHHVKEHDMIPVLCIGETLQEKEQDLTESVLIKQLLPIMGGSEVFNGAIIAYEPVWAIGTGRAATPESIQEVHAFIRAWIQSQGEEVAALSILYGGSVNAENAATIFSLPDVDGGLVGGASLNAQQFVEIVECIS